MPYTINASKQFFTDFANIPKQVQKAYIKHVDATLRGSAEKHNAIKKLKSAKHLWRYRISDDYRIIYEVEKNCVTLLMVGNRKNVYDRLGYNPDKEEFQDTIIGKLPKLVDPEPSQERVGEAIFQSLREESKANLGTKLLPFELSPEKLLAWAIPEQFYSVLQNCKTDDELLAADAPPNIVDKILNGIYPPSIEQTLNAPKFVLDKPDDLEEVATGQKSLSSFLLALDDTQKKYVETFTQKETGPWLLKGGPGSGKSTIALYCIRSLLSNKLSFAKPQRILFTTYTNSLTSSSQQLLRSLLGNEPLDNVDIKTMNSLAAFHADPNGRGLKISESDDEKRILRETISSLQANKKITSFKIDDNEFVKEEIEWIILGNGLQNEDDYVKIDRTGRGRRLGKNQQSDLWRIYESFVSELKIKQLITHDQIVMEAREKAKVIPADQKYDFVFIDEAQDFKPTGIAFCVELAKNPKNVFLTADINQAIYGRAVKWKSVHEALRFTKGKSEELEINYRSTKEIVIALKQIAQQIDDCDPETLVLNTHFSGEAPVVSYCDSAQDEIDKISEFTLNSLKKLNMCLGCAAVLCKNNRDAQDIAKRLSEKLKSKYMATKGLDVDYNGVKVMTIHAAKGLEFPLVSVARVNENSFPSKALGGQDEAEHLQAEWKLLFVACGRAMKALQVTTNKRSPSPFVQHLTDECWSID